MKPTVQILAVLTFLTVCAPLVSARELKIDLKVNGKPIGDIFLQIDGDMATAKVADQTEQYNLKEASWLDPKTGRWTRLDECKEWAEQAKARFLKGADTAPANTRAFLMWSLNPTFKVEKTDDTLRLISGQVDYAMEGQASKDAAESYFRYAVLNAYRKAMTDARMPPFSELRAADEMKKLGYIPRKITVTVHAVPKSPQFEMEITEVSTEYAGAASFQLRSIAEPADPDPTTQTAEERKHTLKGRISEAVGLIDKKDYKTLFEHFVDPFWLARGAAEQNSSIDELITTQILGDPKRSESKMDDLKESLEGSLKLEPRWLLSGRAASFITRGNRSLSEFWIYYDGKWRISPES